jgi:hypothetical protein
MKDTMKFEIRYQLELLRLNVTDFVRGCIVRMIRLHDVLYTGFMHGIGLSVPDFLHHPLNIDPMLYYNSLSCYGTM